MAKRSRRNCQYLAAMLLIVLSETATMAAPPPARESGGQLQGIGPWRGPEHAPRTVTIAPAGALTQALLHGANRLAAVRDGASVSPPRVPDAIQAHSGFPGVPEPAAWAMLLAGLGPVIRACLEWLRRPDQAFR